MTNEIQTITASPVMAFNEETKALIKERYFIEGASDAEFELFITQAQHRGLDPTKKHIYAVERDAWNPKTRRKEPTISYQVSIDGLRLIAHRTGRYEGQTAPMWCGTDGQWTDVWLQAGFPAAAKVGVYVKGFREPTWGIAKWDSYVQTTRDGGPTQFWKKMGDLMLAKCAEALALRKAFPEDMGGLYSTEEMAQADTPIEVEALPQHDQPEPRQLRKGVVDTIHGVLDRKGYTHDDLKRWYQDQGIGSMNDMSIEQLQSILRSLRDDPDTILGRIDDLKDKTAPERDEASEAVVDVAYPNNFPGQDDQSPDTDDDGEIEVFPVTPDNDAGMDAADMLFAVTLDELVESGSEDVKDWEKMTQMAGDAEEAWVKLWDSAPTRLIANMLLARMREEQMVTDATRDARERARTRMMTVS